jgi:hypothetical protein
VGDDVARQRRVHHAGCVKLFAGDRRADDGEDARADDRANAQRSERPRAEALFQPMLGFFRLPNQLIDRFAREVLAGQCRTSLQVSSVRFQGSESRPRSP